MDDRNIITEAVKNIKNAILQSRYVAARMANAELLKLYFSVGGYISENTRNKKWGSGALLAISNQLQYDLPGLKGFSEGNMRKMRIFYESWNKIINSQQANVKKTTLPSPKKANRSAMPNILDISKWSDDDFRSAVPNEIANAFLSISFTHHVEIIMKCDSMEERMFYISKTAMNFWGYRTLQSHIKADDFHKTGTLPNNFALTMPNAKQAAKAVMAFKDEMLLDFINIEEDQDEECIDERVLEYSIVQNIKKFIQKLGTDFCFVDSQHRIVETDEEFFVDLLFYNRTLQALVAIELKRGKFKPAYLGQLNFYLSLLDKYERRENENTSIGILMCKEAKHSIVELAVRDYAKPMGVATYRLTDSVPDAYKVLKPIADAADTLLNSK